MSDSSLSDAILDTIDYALDKKLPKLNRDITLIGRVTKVGENNTYTITVKGVDYIVTASNITLSEMDSVHLVIPNNNSVNKYILEDLIVKYAGDSSGDSGSSGGSGTTTDIDYATNTDIDKILNS